MQSFQVKGNIKLVCRNWLIENAKANIILLHGYAEHSGRYDFEASMFNEAGYNVFAYDHRGYGRSEGERAYVNRFSEYIDDLEVYLDIDGRKINEKPFFIFGHSMGCLISISYLIEKEFDFDNFKGLVLSAPALKIHRSISPLLQKLSGLISIIAPKLQTVPLDNKKLSHDPQVYIDHEADQLNYKGKAKARLGGEMIKQMKSLKNKFSGFEYPFIVFHGDEDLHAEIEGSREFYKLAGSEDKQFVKLEGMHHEITKELDKEKVLMQMIDWMEKRV